MLHPERSNLQSNSEDLMNEGDLSYDISFDTLSLHFIPAPDRQRIKALFTPEQKPVEQAQPMTEQPTSYLVEAPPPKTRGLFSISDDLEKLNELLDETGDDAQQQELINNWRFAVGR